MRKQYIFKLIKIACACIAVSAACTITGLAGYWKANEIGYWYVHDDGSYPQYSWEWIDNDSDGIYMCYAFDEQGYLYTNTVTPDGYVVGPDGSWYSGSVPMTKAFINGASVVPTSIGAYANTNNDTYVYSADGMQLITQKYASPKKNDTTGSGTSTSSKNSSSGSSKSSKTTISSGVSSSEIVTTKYKTGTSSGSASDDDTENTSSTKSSSEPDVNNTSDDSFGPGGNIPKNYSSQTVSPTADTREYAPKSSNVRERVEYEDEDQGDDEED